ncbi:collagen-like protein [Acidocella sp.]|uniref:collagen-like protein n=1 Tax=Acidocella sp. TaxID=50710 RepID=UPI002621A56C|nr:collagen-like protein [Acidocella sp.]
MTTIAQLPPASSVGAGDLLPLSQGGTLCAASVDLLLAGTQPALAVPGGALLGRVSIGAGGPEPVALGVGLALGAGTLAADGLDHGAFPVLGTLSMAEELVVSTAGAPGLLPVAALRGVFAAGTGVTIDTGGTIGVTVSELAGPAGPQGGAGPVGPQGPQGPQGPAGAGLAGPAAGTAASAVGTADYVALWQNGALAWLPYGQFLGGQTIDELAAAGPALDSDEMLVAQGGGVLAAQSFSGLWSYVANKLPSALAPVMELTGDTLLDATAHNNRLLVASAPLTLSASFPSLGAGFGCTVINLSAGPVVMGAGIQSGSGAASLPPGASAVLYGLSYSGGSLVWWSGTGGAAPAITVNTINAPAPGAGFVVAGGIFNDAPAALDYSADGGATWSTAPGTVMTANAYSFTAPGLGAGTYAVRVRDHGNPAVLGVSNSFTIAAPTIALGALPGTVASGMVVNVTGSVSPAGSAVVAGLSASATTAPASWVNAVVAGAGWTANLTPATVGSWYVWARQEADVAVAVVSAALSAVAATLTVSAPGTGMAGAGLSVTGTVSPAADAVTMALATQNGTAPASGWVAATNSGGAFAATLTPSAAGTYYVWAQDAATGLYAVSGAVAMAAGSVTYGINNPGGSYVHGVGTIALGGGVSPAQPVPTQVALSASGTVAPAAGWQAASNINNNAMWAVNYPAPATPGAYYVWVETASGQDGVVSSFTLTVN